MKKIRIPNLKIILLLVIILSIIAAIVLPIANVIYWAKPGKEISITIKQGEGTREISKNLKDAGAIKSSLAFNVYVYSRHLLLQSGYYKIKSSMSLADIAAMINEGRIEEYVITIPEGWRTTQIEDLLVAKGVTSKGEFMKIAASKEGYLFPDTYRFPLDADAETIFKALTDNFSKKTNGLNVTKKDLIIASIVEREAKNDEERSQIAAVYLNRLKIGMRLEADPTIQYGKGDWGPITKNDYKNFINAYNTYLIDGLPPTPICNPGIKSIEAALNPAEHDYLFFFHQTNGEAIFSKTYQEHLDNLKKN